MNYHDITKQDMLNGDGIRVVLWVAGCSHHCPKCQNPITWDPDGGLPFDEKAEKELFEALDKSFIDGITFSGGDPLHPANRAEVERLIQKVKENWPDKTIWLYTGYKYEEIEGLPFVAMIDVIVDGEYVESLDDFNYEWAGSTNQRVIRRKQ